MLTTFLFTAVCFLAYSNGANDNFKGVATLYGSDTTNYKTAIIWGTCCTFLGSCCSLFLAEMLLKSFSGKGLVPVALVESEQFLFAVATGAGATVLVATLTGMPISTTHGLVGALVGAGFVASGGEINYLTILNTFFIPLLISPLVALCLGALLYTFFHVVRIRCGVNKEYCLCIGDKVIAIPQPVTESLHVDVTHRNMEITVDAQTQCAQQYVGQFFGVHLQQIIDGLHFLSAGLVSFARGLNDTPKIAALLIVVPAIDMSWGITSVAVTMALGGIINARRVAETMGHKITDMNHGQAVSANLATAFLVIVASRYGMPVSTTHVSVGSLFGIGVVSRSAHYRSIGAILLAWIFTLPCAGFLAALSYISLP